MIRLKIFIIINIFVRQSEYFPLGFRVENVLKEERYKRFSDRIYPECGKHFSLS